MKLSEAIVLGNSLVCREPLQFFSHDASRGCAIGGAMVAAGMAEQFLATRSGTGGAGITTLPVVHEAWPWLHEWHVAEISRMYAVGRHIEEIAQCVQVWEREAERVETAQQDEQLPHGWRDAHVAMLDVMSGARGGGE